jgi:glutathione synthase
MYGVDTLMGDDEKRILSEINTTSIGGIIQMEKQQGKALTKATTDQIWNFIRFKIIKKNAISS